MFRQTLSLGLLLSTLAIAPLPLRAQSSSPFPPATTTQTQPPRQGRLLDQLNLSPAQKQQIVGIRDRYRPQLQPLKQQLHQERDQLQTLKSQNADPGRIAAAQTRLNQLRQQARTLKQQMQSEIQAVLTPAQQQQLAQLRQNRSVQREKSEQ